jgi:hypothetical protein
LLLEIAKANCSALFTVASSSILKPPAMTKRLGPLPVVLLPA